MSWWIANIVGILWVMVLVSIPVSLVFCRIVCKGCSERQREIARIATQLTADQWVNKEMREQRDRERAANTLLVTLFDKSKKESQAK